MPSCLHADYQSPHPRAADIDLLDILNCPDEDDAPPPGELDSPVVKTEPTLSTVANSSQDVASIMPAAVFEGMPQHYGATMFHQEQHLYQPVPEMFGLSCSMHQPMPIVPPQFRPAAAPVSSEPVEKPAVVEAKKECPSRGRRSQQKVRHWWCDFCYFVTLAFPQSMEEVMMQEERVKKRRRESAQRSRARKNCYVKNLEYENRSLKAEVEKLRSLLAQVDSSLRTAGSPSFTPAIHPVMTPEVDGYSAAA